MFNTLAVLTLATASLLPSQTLTQHEREFAMSHLHATRKMFLDSITGLTPEQWTFKAAPDRWSIAECAEHIATSEDFIFGLVTTQVMKSPADPSKKAEVKGKDEVIVKQVPERSQKFKAPDVIAPKNRWSTPDAIVAHFKEGRDRSIAYVDTTQDDLRDHFAPHPVMGTLDGYQWILLMSAHSERHTEQINEVKADPKYPK
jgi:uncharacterized damage-inducible protein DinB